MKAKLKQTMMDTAASGSLNPPPPDPPEDPLHLRRRVPEESDDSDDNSSLPVGAPHDDDDDYDKNPRRRPSHFLWCWRAMDKDFFFYSIMVYLITWMVFLGCWSHTLLEAKATMSCLDDGHDDEIVTLAACLGMVALVVSMANPILGSFLGSLPNNPEPPYSQDQRDRQVVIFVFATVSAIWTSFCGVYHHKLKHKNCVPTLAPTPLRIGTIGMDVVSKDVVSSNGQLATYYSHDSIFLDWPFDASDNLLNALDDLEGTLDDFFGGRCSATYSTFHDWHD